MTAIIINTISGKYRPRQSVRVCNLKNRRDRTFQITSSNMKNKTIRTATKLFRRDTYVVRFGGVHGEIRRDQTGC